MRIKILFVIALAVMSGASIGCAKKMEAAGPATFNPDGPFIPPGEGPGQLPGNDLQYGGTATMLTNTSAMAYYLGWTPNELSDVKININLMHYEDVEKVDGKNQTFSGWGGTVTISFKNDGIYYQDTFSSLVNPWGMVKTNGRNNQYNNWFTKNGRQYWHGFFQDYYGAVIIVFDDVVDLGDGQGPQAVNGEVWVKNHPLSYAPLSPTSCWFVTLGPYDCRTWKIDTGNKGVDWTRAIYPLTADGYRKIGEFDDLDVNKAFNAQQNEEFYAF